jgi:hypothetical protein
MIYSAIKAEYENGGEIRPEKILSKYLSDWVSFKVRFKRAFKRFDTLFVVNDRISIAWHKALWIQSRCGRK